METQNDFMILRETVNKAVSQYTELRKRIDWKDSGKSATIYRLAKPFQTGFFTIAIAGKMSSGKSTFINSLIGENLLPTGIFQTTSCITWIVSSDRRYMEVTYANKKKEIFTENLAEKLHKLVAVPDEFHSLPINHINNLIKENNDIETILKQKDYIEEITDTNSDEKLWKEYVKSTPKSKIAEKVTIYLPLPAEYKGWRIVDTPGIGAIGGIQEATKKLIISKEGENDTVDAVILLQNGTEGVEDESANKFAKEVRNSMGDLAKGRLFFVLTHAGNTDFQFNKDKILERANSNFGKKLNIPKEKITYVDSLIHHFLVDARKSHRDFSDFKSLNIILEGWNEKDWNILKSHISQFYVDLISNGIEVTNNSLFAKLESVSQFESLRDLLYEFLNNEKENAFNELLTLINGELLSYEKSLRRDIKAVSNGQVEIDLQIKGAKEEETNLNLALVKVQQKATPSAIEKKFDFIDSKLQELSKSKSINEVKTKYLEMDQEILLKQKEFFKALKDEFSRYVGEFKEPSVTFESLDWDDLVRKANDKVTDKGFIHYIEILFDLIFKNNVPQFVWNFYSEKILFNDSKCREFANLVIKEGHRHNKSFQDGLKVKVKEFFNIVSLNIKEKTCAIIEHLEYYKKSMVKSETHLEELNGKLSEVERQLTELQNYYD